MTGRKQGRLRSKGISRRPIISALRPPTKVDELGALCNQGGVGSTELRIELPKLQWLERPEKRRPERRKIRSAYGVDKTKPRPVLTSDYSGKLIILPIPAISSSAKARRYLAKTYWRVALLRLHGAHLAAGMAKTQCAVVSVQETARKAGRTGSQMGAGRGLTRPAAVSRSGVSKNKTGHNIGQLLQGLMRYRIRPSERCGHPNSKEAVASFPDGLPKTLRPRWMCPVP
jgi:hypothetical protein